MQLPYLIYIPTIYISLALAIIVCVNNRRKSANLIFSVFILAAVFWMICNLLADIAKDVNSALFWSRMAIIGPAFMPALLLHFSFVFPRLRRKLSRNILILLYSPILLFLILTPTDWNVSRVVIQEWGADVTPGFLYYPLFIYFLVYVGFALYNFIKSYRVSEKTERIQIKLIFWGMSIGIAWGVFANLILPLLGTSRLSAFGPLSVLILVIFTTYAITKHHLFNIRVIATELFTALIILVLLVQVLLSENITQLLLRIGMLILVIFFGILLIRSILQEVKRREQIQTLVKKLIEANTYLKQLMKTKSEFLTIVSHQLRTPVSIIRTALSMVVSGDVTGKKKDEYVENAYSASNRLEELVSGLLSATELESGRMKLNLRETDIEALVKEIMDELRSKAKEKNLVFEYQSLTKPLPKIKVDPMMIKEAITALIDNAIIYTPKGFVKVFCETRDRNLILSVKDSGLGIAKEDLAKLYKKFARGRRAIQVVPNGTGLGLYNTKMIIELHRGKIEVESEGREKGSTFKIILSLK